MWWKSKSNKCTKMFTQKSASSWTDGFKVFSTLFYYQEYVAFNNCTPIQTWVDCAVDLHWDSDAGISIGWDAKRHVLLLLLWRNRIIGTLRIWRQIHVKWYTHCSPLERNVFLLLLIIIIYYSCDTLSYKISTLTTFWCSGLKIAAKKLPVWNPLNRFISNTYAVSIQFWMFILDLYII